MDIPTTPARPTSTNASPTPAARPALITGDPLPATTTVTYREAAELLGCSADTVERARKAGRYPGSAQEVTGKRGWRIPLGDLVAAGQLDAARVTEVDAELASHREARQVRELREESIWLKAQLEASQARQNELVQDKQHLMLLLETVMRGGAPVSSKRGA